VLEGALPFPHNYAIYSPRKRGDEWGKDGWRSGKGRVGEWDDSSSVRGAVHQCLNPQTNIYSHPTILTNRVKKGGKENEKMGGLSANMPQNCGLG